MNSTSASNNIHQKIPLHGQSRPYLYTGVPTCGAPCGDGCNGRPQWHCVCLRRHQLRQNTHDDGAPGCPRLLVWGVGVQYLSYLPDLPTASETSIRCRKFIIFLFFLLLTGCAVCRSMVIISALRCTETQPGCLSRPHAACPPSSCPLLWANTQQRTSAERLDAKLMSRKHT